MSRKSRQGGRLGVLTLASVALVAGCRPASQVVLPKADLVASYYHYEGNLKAELNGNVAEITVSQPAAQLRHGGALWAKVGPYILLFSDETRKLFQDYPDLAGVRVITKVNGGPEVARALLSRTELSDIQWRRALNIAGKARRDGSDKPGLLDDLVRWGEEHTQFEYSPRYTKTS